MSKSVSDILLDELRELRKKIDAIATDVATLKAKQVTQPCADMRKIKGFVWTLATTNVLTLFSAAYAYFKMKGQ